MVDQRALLDRGENAERHRDQHRDDEPHQGEFRRRRQARGDVGDDRLPGRQRLAEVAMGEIDDVAQELLRQRLVEAELLADVLDRLRARRRPREIGRSVSGQHAGEEERDDDDADQAGDHRQQPLSDLPQHRCFTDIGRESAIRRPEFVIGTCSGRSFPRFEIASMSSDKPRPEERALARVSKDGHGEVAPVSILRDAVLRTAPELGFGHF